MKKRTENVAPHPNHSNKCVHSFSSVEVQIQQRAQIGAVLQTTSKDLSASANCVCQNPKDMPVNELHKLVSFDHPKKEYITALRGSVHSSDYPFDYLRMSTFRIDSIILICPRPTRRSSSNIFNIFYNQFQKSNMYLSQ